MPVKKSSSARPKAARKGSSKHQVVDAAVAEQAAAAVAELPGLMRGVMPEPEQKIQSVHKLSHHMPGQKNKKLLMQVAVAGFTLVIFGLWLVNMRSVFTTVSDTRSQEISLIDRANQDAKNIVDSINNATPPAERLPVDQRDLRTTLTETLANLVTVINAAIATSTPTTTESAISPTSTTTNFNFPVAATATPTAADPTITQ